MKVAAAAQMLFGAMATAAASLDLVGWPSRRRDRACSRSCILGLESGTKRMGFRLRQGKERERVAFDLLLRDEGKSANKL